MPGNSRNNLEVRGLCSKNKAPQMAFDWPGLFTGRWSKYKFSALYFTIIFLLLSCWAIARAFYPIDNGYCIDVCRISRQGNLSVSPVGGWFFIVSTGIAGLFFVLYFIFAYRRLLGGCIFLARLFLFCGCAGGVGFFLLGVCPEGSGPAVQALHDFGAEMAYGGLSTAVGLSFLILSLKLRQKKTWPSRVQFLVLFLIVFHFAIIIPYTSNFPALQWAGFSAVLVWQLVFFLILPESVDELKKTET